MNFESNMYPEATEVETKSYNYNYMETGCCKPMPNPCPCGQTIMCQPVVECPQFNCCHRVINYEVPHIIPCHTTMVNHHIYKHTYQPCYSYSEEDETSEIYEPKCCK